MSADAPTRPRARVHLRGAVRGRLRSLLRPATLLSKNPAAAATFAAEKLAKAFGKDINDLIKIRYKVSGSWDNPVIKVIGRKNDPLDDVQELLK